MLDTYPPVIIQKMKDFFSKCHQIPIFLRIWSNLLKKSLMEIFFCAVCATFNHAQPFFQIKMKYFLLDSLASALFWGAMSWWFRCSHQRCSLRKGFLIRFAKFTGKNLCWSLFLNKREPRIGVFVGILRNFWFFCYRTPLDSWFRWLRRWSVVPQSTQHLIYPETRISLELIIKSNLLPCSTGQSVNRDLRVFVISSY